jgi:hypothetical protein
MELTASPVQAARTAIAIAARYLVLIAMSPLSPHELTGSSQKWFPSEWNIASRSEIKGTDQRSKERKRPPGFRKYETVARRYQHGACRG